MKYLNFTFPTPEENLACDELLLDLCEDGSEDEVLRFWEPQQPFVVLGYSNQIKAEVRQTACKRLGIPVIRRTSGGGAVTQGPGCLNYALILHITPQTRNITQTNQYVMARIKQSLEPLVGPMLDIRGDTDLTLGPLKLAGNAQRRRRQALLFHGTFLLFMDFELIEETLKMPRRQPVYRQNRTHKDFLFNLNLPGEMICKNMREEWQANTTLSKLPHDRIQLLVREKYANKEWNCKF
jgi:lipoate-protein ligase A